MVARIVGTLAVATLLRCSITARADAPASRPTTAPTTRPAPIRQSIDRGVAFLVKAQNADGSWGKGTETRGFEVYSMVPGTHDAFRVATTALCVMALREAGEAEAHGRGVNYLISQGDARRQDGALIYNTWAHTYAVQALSIELRSTTNDARQEAVRRAIVNHLKRLGSYETYIGGWNYYDFEAQTEKPSMGPTSFGTAAGLVALWEARRAGVDVPQKMIDLSVRRLAEMRLPNGAYLYSHDMRLHPRAPANRPRGSIGRSQSGNFALWLWNAGGIDDAKARAGLDMFFKEHEFIEMGRKRQFPHEAWYQTAPYYYYFGHYYAARLVERLERPEDRRTYGAKLAEIGILGKQDADGSWWDFAMWDFHKPYGTAYAIMTLLRCE